MASIIGALRVTLGMDTAAFESGAAKAKTQAAGLKGVLGSFASAFTPISLGATAAAAGIAAFTLGMKKAAEATQFADDLAAQAYKIGVSAESLQKLRFAAEEVDVPAATLDQTMKSLNGTLGALQSGIGDGRIRAAFEALGIPQSAIQSMQSATDLLPILADKISQVGTHAEKVQIAKKLGIEELLPLLEEGAAGIDGLTKKFDDLNLGMSEELVNRMADLNREMEIADQRATMAGLSVGSRFAPALIELKNAATDAVVKLDPLIERLGRVASGYAALVKYEQAGFLNTLRNPRGALAAMKAGAADYSSMAAPDRSFAVSGAVPRLGLQSSGRGGSRGGGAKSPLDGLQDGSVAADLSKTGLDWSIQEKDVSELTAQIGEITSEGAYQGQLDGIARSKQEMQDNYRDAIGGGLYAAVYGGGKGLMEYLADSFKRRLIDNLADGLASVFSQIGSPGGGGGGGIVGTLLSVGKKIFGFASGGSGVVGGSGGVDSQLVSMRLTPGELVDVRRPGQDRGAGGGVVVQVEASPYFDVRVRQVAAPLAVQAAVGGANLAATRGSRAASRRLSF